MIGHRISSVRHNIRYNFCHWPSFIRWLRWVVKRLTDYVTYYDDMTSSSLLQHKTPHKHEFLFQNFNWYCFTMTARQRFNGSENQQVHAWILGSTIASLASAVHIIQEAKVPASQIHIVESRKSGEDGLPTTGNATVGYDHQAACMSILYDDCTKDLLSLVPSVTRSDKSLLDDITGEQRVPAARHIMIKGDTKRHTIDTRRIRIGLKTRIKLAIFVSQSEKTLGQHTIRDFFNKRFFKTTFWSIWASVYATP